MVSAQKELVIIIPFGCSYYSLLVPLSEFSHLVHSALHFIYLLYFCLHHERELLKGCLRNIC
jgi:hypothetical protein